MKIAIWGSGITGKRILHEVLSSNKYKIESICFIDSDIRKDKTKENNLNVYHYDWLIDNPIDLLIIGTYTGYNEILSLIYNMNVHIKHIDTSYVDLQYSARITFLENFASMSNKITGSVAEVGVYRGEFAKHINRCFPNRVLYLYDTFSGFAEEDIVIEQNLSNNTDLFQIGALNDTSIEIVLSKMINPDKVVICKGRFPESFTQTNTKFAFINIDMDLYEPTKNAVYIFYPLLEKGGVILVHDYFNPDCRLVPKAVDDAEILLKEHLIKLPIGDKMSIAIIKK